jgi:hypothetical protein
MSDIHEMIEKFKTSFAALDDFSRQSIRPDTTMKCGKDVFSSAPATLVLAAVMGEIRDELRAIKRLLEKDGSSKGTEISTRTKPGI